MSDLKHPPQSRETSESESRAEDLEQITKSGVDNSCSPLQENVNDESNPDSFERTILENELSCLQLPSPLLSPVSSVSPSTQTESVFNPFELRSRESLTSKPEALLESLSFHAVQLSLECIGITRIDFFSHSACFAGLFVPGLIPGKWQLLDRSEVANCSPQIRFVKKFRLRAATALDRKEVMLVALFDGDRREEWLDPMRGWGYQEFSVEELLSEKQMIAEKNLKAEKRGMHAKGSVVLALEMVYHVDKDSLITFDIGFLESAPRRNRMFFVISRALRRGKWSPVYRSEVRIREDIAKFEPATLGAQEFHSGDVTKLFRIEMHRSYKNGKTKLLGFVQTSVEKLESMEANAQLYWWPAPEGITSAKVVIQYIEKTQNEHFFSFRIAGHS